MKMNHLRFCAVCALALAGMTVGAMPVGVRLAMQGRAVARASAGPAFPELPDTASPEAVVAALSVATDGRLAENITTVGEYADFRDWASTVGAATVKTSDTAWLSYAVGAAAVVPIPQEGDLVLDGVSVGSDGRLEAIVSLDGVSISAAAQEARLKTVFGVEGAGTLNESAFSPDNVGLSLVPTGDGRLKATVTPPADAGDAYFMRLKVK